MGKNIGKNISKNLSGKYCQKSLDHAKQSATDAFKTASEKAIQKTAEATGDLICDKIAYEIIKVSKNLQQNNSDTVTNENYRVIPKERHIYPDERQTIIDRMRLINFLDNVTNQTIKFRKYLI